MNTNWTFRGEMDLEIYGSIAELQLAIPLLILFLFCKLVLVSFINLSTLYTKSRNYL